MIHALIAASALFAQVHVSNLDGRLVDPFEVPRGTTAIVFLFTTTECPISNRYAPEVRRLYEAFAPRGVVFRLVYANPAENADAIRKHLEAFSYPATALRDPRHELVGLAQATVTPEAAVFAPPPGGFGARARDPRLVYRGRIDDRYVDLGVDRQTPTRRDLEDALQAVLAGTPIREPVTRAVGCILADLVR